MEKGNAFTVSSIQVEDGDGIWMSIVIGIKLRNPGTRIRGQTQSHQYHTWTGSTILKLANTGTAYTSPKIADTVTNH